LDRAENIIAYAGVLGLDVVKAREQAMIDNRFM